MTPWIFAIDAGYEDENTQLRHEPALSVVADRTSEENLPWGSPPTLRRLENRISCKTIGRLLQVLADQCLASSDGSSAEVVLDLDATDDPLYGPQEERFLTGMTAAPTSLRRHTARRTA